MAKQQAKQLAPNVTTDKTRQPQSLVPLTEVELNAIAAGISRGDLGGNHNETMVSTAQLKEGDTHG